MRRLQPHPAPPLLGVRYRTQIQSQADLRRKASSTSARHACSYPHSCSGTCSSYPYSGAKHSSWDTTILEYSPASRTDFSLTLDLQGTLLRGSTVHDLHSPAESSTRAQEASGLVAQKRLGTVGAAPPAAGPTSWRHRVDN